MEFEYSFTEYEIAEGANRRIKFENPDACPLCGAPMERKTEQLISFEENALGDFWECPYCQAQATRYYRPVVPVGTFGAQVDAMLAKMMNEA